MDVSKTYSDTFGLFDRNHFVLPRNFLCKILVDVCYRRFSFRDLIKNQKEKKS